MKRYAIITAAHNEAALISRTIESVLAQTILPVRWVIVSDRSTDDTDRIVAEYCSKYRFMRLLRLENNVGRGVVAKINALTLAQKNLSDCPHEFIGNLDADVSFGNDYYERLLQYFEQDPDLGIGGGLIYEKSGAEFRSRLSNSISSVAHATQMVRRQCYDEIGGYVALQYGGEDWYAEIRARMKGWHVSAFPDLKVMHHRPTGGADRILKHRFREGKMDHSVGSHPIFEFIKCARRLPEKPFAIGACARFAGFCWSSFLGRPRLVSSEAAQFLRNEQMKRVRALPRSGFFNSELEIPR